MRYAENRFLMFGIGLLLGLFTLLSVRVQAREADSPYPPSAGVYIDLTRDFYQALQEDGSRGSERVYSNEMSYEYLRQISVSARFMVETNLQILRQQERVIQLLERVLEQGKKK
jgi:hypothetical protein